MVKKITSFINTLLILFMIFSFTDTSAVETASLRQGKAATTIKINNKDKAAFLRPSVNEYQNTQQNNIKFITSANFKNSEALPVLMFSKEHSVKVFCSNDSLDSFFIQRLIL